MFAHLNVDISNKVITKVVTDIHLFNRTIAVLTLYKDILGKISKHDRITCQKYQHAITQFYYF